MSTDRQRTRGSRLSRADLDALRRAAWADEILAARRAVFPGSDGPPFPTLRAAAGWIRAPEQATPAPPVPPALTARLARWAKDAGRLAGELEQHGRRLMWGMSIAELPYFAGRSRELVRADAWAGSPLWPLYLAARALDVPAADDDERARFVAYVLTDEPPPGPVVVSTATQWTRLVPDGRRVTLRYATVQLGLERPSERGWKRIRELVNVAPPLTYAGAEWAPPGTVPALHAPPPRFWDAFRGPRRHRSQAERRASAARAARRADRERILLGEVTRARAGGPRVDWAAVVSRTNAQLPASDRYRSIRAARMASLRARKRRDQM